MGSCRRLALSLAVLSALTSCGVRERPHPRDPLPAGEVYGIDVSNHQGKIDWDRVAGDRTRFAYIKASEGGDFTDVRFAANWRSAGAAGVRRGAYHFFTLCRHGKDQAANFLSIAHPDQKALPPAVDLELTGNCPARPARQDVLAELVAFLGPVEAAWGRPALLYVGRDWEQTYPVLARSGRERWLVSHVVPPPEPWTVWQGSDHAQVHGIAGPVDLDVARLHQLSSR